MHNECTKRKKKTIKVSATILHATSGTPFGNYIDHILKNGTVASSVYCMVYNGQFGASFNVILLSVQEGDEISFASSIGNGSIGANGRADINVGLIEKVA